MSIPDADADADADTALELRNSLDPSHVSFYRSAYRGRLVVLCGGTTLNEQPLELLHGTPTLGVNESFRGAHPATRYPSTWAHLLSDWRGADAYGAEVVRRWPLMLTFQKIASNSHVAGTIPLIRRNGEEFRTDLARGVWNICAPVLALQLGVYLGFTDIVFAGLDLKRRSPRLHWWSSEPDVRDPSHDWNIQRAALRKCAAHLSRYLPHVRVCNVSHDTTCDAFEQRRFDDVFGGAASRVDERSATRIDNVIANHDERSR